MPLSNACLLASDSVFMLTLMAMKITHRSLSLSSSLSSVFFFTVVQLRPCTLSSLNCNSLKNVSLVAEQVTQFHVCVRCPNWPWLLLNFVLLMLARQRQTEELDNLSAAHSALLSVFLTMRPPIYTLLWTQFSPCKNSQGGNGIFHSVTRDTAVEKLVSFFLCLCYCWYCITFSIKIIEFLMLEKQQKVIKSTHPSSTTNCSTSPCPSGPLTTSRDGDCTIYFTGQPVQQSCPEEFRVDGCFSYTCLHHPQSGSSLQTQSFCTFLVHIGL